LFGARSNWNWFTGKPRALPLARKLVARSSNTLKCFTTGSGSTVLWITGRQKDSNSRTIEPPMLEEQNSKNKILAAHLGGGLGSQGGAQQGTGARGEQYLDGLARSHTIAAWILFGTSHAPKYIHAGRNEKTSLTDCPFFRS